MPACATAAQEAVPAGACLGSWQCRIRTCAPLARVVHACRHLSFVSFGAAFAQFAWICFLKELHFLKERSKNIRNPAGFNAGFGYDQARIRDPDLGKTAAANHVCLGTADCAQVRLLWQWLTFQTEALLLS